MIFAKVDVDLSDHLKAVDAGPAMATWLWALLYSRKHELDGAVPDSAFRLSWVGEATSKEHSSRLVEVGLWKRSRAGIVILNYGKHNETREQIAQRREIAAERMRRVRANTPRTNSEHTANVRDVHTSAVIDQSQSQSQSQSQKLKDFPASPDGADVAPKKKSPRKVREPAEGDYAKVIDAYHRAFLNLRGIAPVIDGRAGQAAKKLLAAMPVDEVVTTIRSAFEDEFFQKASGELWQIGNTPNKYRKGTPKAPPVWKPRDVPNDSQTRLTARQYADCGAVIDPLLAAALASGAER